MGMRHSDGCVLSRSQRPALALLSWGSTWLQWEAEVFRYERESGRSFPVEIGVFVVLNRAPVLRTHLEAAKRCRGGGHRDSDPSTKNETTPMDVDHVWKGNSGKGGKRKNKGTGKGKNFTKRKVEKGKARRKANYRKTVDRGRPFPGRVASCGHQCPSN
eukprot:1624021-Amphidinium_carterae.1